VAGAFIRLPFNVPRRLDAMQPSVFSLDRVAKRFGYAPVLEDVSFDLPEGECALLLGNNGAGKSTLLRILSTLMRPSAGTVRFRGLALPEAGDAARRELGVISHESRLYGDLTARENLRLFGTLYGVEGLSGAVPAVLERVRLDDVPDVPVRAFSSGMVKRLGLARLLLYRPRVLLLDEPYSGLDQSSLELFDAYLREFRGGGGTVVLVTHQFTNGIGLCNRVLILHRGRLVYNQPAQHLDAATCARLLRERAGGNPAAAPS
jgi:heme exporter protein A